MSSFFANDLFNHFLTKYIFNIINPKELKRNIFVKYSLSKNNSFWCPYKRGALGCRPSGHP
jgi:hypothetical protein